MNRPLRAQALTLRPSGRGTVRPLGGVSWAVREPPLPRVDTKTRWFGEGIKVRADEQRDPRPSRLPPRRALPRSENLS